MSIESSTNPRSEIQDLEIDFRSPISDLPTYRSVKPRSRAAWRTWLAKHHEKAAGVWLVLAKKHTGLATVAYNDAVEEALCFGWIDTTLNPMDDRFYKQLFTPRRPEGHVGRVEQGTRRTADRGRPDDRRRPGGD